MGERQELETSALRSSVKAGKESLLAAHRANGDKSGGKASYWLRRAAMNLDCAVQCCGTEDSTEIDAMEKRCDELSVALAKDGR